MEHEVINGRCQLESDWDHLGLSGGHRWKRLEIESRAGLPTWNSSTETHTRKIPDEKFLPIILL